MFGQFMIIFFVVLAVLATIGFWMKKRAQKAGTYKEKDPDKVLENAADLGDRLNRARYQSQDGQ